MLSAHWHRIEPAKYRRGALLNNCEKQLTVLYGEDCVCVIIRARAGVCPVSPPPTHRRIPCRPKYRRAGRTASSGPTPRQSRRCNPQRTRWGARGGRQASGLAAERQEAGRHGGASTPAGGGRGELDLQMRGGGAGPCGGPSARGCAWMGVWGGDLGTDLDLTSGPARPQEEGS